MTETVFRQNLFLSFKVLNYNSSFARMEKLRLKSLLSNSSHTKKCLTILKPIFNDNRLKSFLPDELKMDLSCF